MWKSSVCTKDCPDTCGLLVKVEDGKIKKVKGDPLHPYTRGFICRKANFFPEHVHNKDRILTPLKRIGRKGSGSFEPISWCEAIDTIAEKIKDVSEKHGADSILPYYYAGHMGIIHRNAGHAFFHKSGACRMLPTICGPAAGEGFKATLGKGPSTDIESTVDSDFIVIWGNNTLTTNVHAWAFFQKARKEGAKIAVIDPYKTRTAKKADIHLMPKPGTDAALALGMMNILIKENLTDPDYISEQTTGFEDLANRAKEYPPEKVSEICGVPVNEIKEFALAYGKAKAPYIRTGWGPARQLHGAMAMRTIACLPALVGAFRKKGGGITRSLGGGPSDLSVLTRPDLAPKPPRIVNMVELGNALTKLDNPPIKIFYNYMSNPAAVAPQSSMVINGLMREDLFTIVHEHYMTDTALYADIILPSATFLEMKDIYKCYGHNYLKIAEPVIPPVGESRTNLSIFQSLAEKMGYEEEVFKMNEDDLIKELLKDPNPTLKGIDQKALLEGKAIRLNIPKNPYENGFNTQSGKVELFSKTWEEKGLDPLPCGKVLRDPDGENKYKLELITPPHHLFLNSAFNEIKEIRKLAGKPSLLINPIDAETRKIKEGDLVKVFNDRGECRLHANITNDTQIGLVVAEGLRWPKLMAGKKGANQLTSQRLTDQGLTCAFHCSRVEVTIDKG